MNGRRRAGIVGYVVVAAMVVCGCGATTHHVSLSAGARTITLRDVAKRFGVLKVTAGPGGILLATLKARKGNSGDQGNLWWGRAPNTPAWYVAQAGYVLTIAGGCCPTGWVEAAGNESVTLKAVGDMSRVTTSVSTIKRRLACARPFPFLIARGKNYLIGCEGRLYAVRRGAAARLIMPPSVANTEYTGNGSDVWVIRQHSVFCECRAGSRREYTVGPPDFFMHSPDAGGGVSWCAGVGWAGGPLLGPNIGSKVAIVAADGRVTLLVPPRAPAWKSLSCSGKRVALLTSGGLWLVRNVNRPSTARLIGLSGGGLPAAAVTQVVLEKNRALFGGNTASGGFLDMRQLS